MNEVFVRLVALDPRVRGFVRPDCNGDYNIYINTMLCFEAQQETLRHELQHIHRHHVYSERPVKDMEEEIRRKV